MVGIAGGLIGGAVINILIKANDKYSKEITKAQKQLRNLGKTGALIGTALATGIFIAVKAANKLESAFRNVDIILGEVGAAEKRFGSIVKDLSSNLAIQGGRVEVLNGLYQVISSGITDTEEATALLTTATKQAVAGNIDLTTSVDALSAFIRGYGVSATEATRISGRMFKAVDLGQITFQGLADNVGKVIPLAAAMGTTMEEVLAVFSTLTGVTGDVSEVSTQLASIFRALLKPTQEMEDALQLLGFSSATAALEALGLQGLLQGLRDVTNDDVTAFADLFGRLEAVNAALLLTGDSAGTFLDNLKLINDETGTLDAKLEIASDTFENKFILAVNNAQLALEDIGKAFKKALGPVLTEVITPGLKALNTILGILPDEGKESVALFLIIGAAVSFLAVAIAAVLLILAPLAGGFAAAALIIGGVTAGIFLLVKAGQLLISNWDKIKAKTAEVFGDLKILFTVLLPKWAKTGFDFVIDLIQGWLNLYVKAINFVINLLDKIPGINISFRIPELDLGRLSDDRNIPLLEEAPTGKRALVAGDTPGSTIIVNIDTVQGLDAEDISQNLSRELSNKVSL